MNQRTKEGIIDSFSGDYEFLSNYAHSPILFSGKIWPTAEHLYQASKTYVETEREKIRTSNSPDEAKKLGKQIIPLSTWKKQKQQIMLKCLRMKFQQNYVLQQKLLETNHNILIEKNNWHDNTWGDCFCNVCRDIEGKNYLGQILMQIRNELAQSTRRYLSIAVPSPSSRFFPQIVEFFHLKGLHLMPEGKSLFLRIEEFEFIFARGFDIPNIVAMGWADLGITGVDTLYEGYFRQVHHLCNLGIRHSDVVLVSNKLKDVSELQEYDTVITEYVKIAEDYFNRNKIYNLNLVHVTGAAEAYSKLSEISAIITLRTSGKSLADNNLNILDIIFRTQACLISNDYISFSKKAQIIRFMEKIR